MQFTEVINTVAELCELTPTPSPSFANVEDSRLALPEGLPERTIWSSLDMSLQFRARDPPGRVGALRGWDC